MGETPKFLTQLQQDVSDWAAQQDNIRALLVAGSQARTDHPADQWSDLDLEFFVTDPQPFLGDNTSWFEAFGPVWTHLDLVTAEDTPQRLVLYDGGHKVDFTFFNIATLHYMVDEQRLLDSQVRGYAVLVDKDGLAAQLPTARTKLIQPPPTEAHYQTLVNAFWYTVVYLAKQIRRRNLWVAKYRDWTLKTQLLHMVEWHCQALADTPLDTWHDGHFIFEWVDAMTWQELQETFDGFSAAQSWRALINAVDLFRRLARETAAALDFTYPEALDANVTQYIRALQRDDNMGQAL